MAGVFTSKADFYEGSTYFGSPPGTGRPATGATAGIPGAFTPTGCDLPAGLTSMTGIVASPATPWTTGQYVQTATPGAPGRVTWSGTSWVGGAAPLEAEAPAAEPPAEPGPEYTEAT